MDWLCVISGLVLTWAASAWALVKGPIASRTLVVLLAALPAFQYLGAGFAMPNWGWLLAWLFQCVCVGLAWSLLRNARTSRSSIDARLQGVAILLSWLVSLGMVLQLRFSVYPRLGAPLPEPRDLLLFLRPVVPLVLGLGALFCLRCALKHRELPRPVRTLFSPIERMFALTLGEKDTDAEEEPGLAAVIAGVAVALIGLLTAFRFLGFQHSLGPVKFGEIIFLSSLLLLAAVASRVGRTAAVSSVVPVRGSLPPIRRAKILLAAAFGLPVLSSFARSDVGVALSTAFAGMGMYTVLRKWSHIPGVPRRCWFRRTTSGESGRSHSLQGVVVFGVGALLVAAVGIIGLQKGRIASWLDPWQFPWTLPCTTTHVDGIDAAAGYRTCVVSVADYAAEAKAQLARAMTAVEGGGLFGRGLADTESAMVPAFHTDFVLVSLWSKLGGLITAGSVLTFGFLALLLASLSRTRYVTRPRASVDLTHDLVCAGAAAYFMLQPGYVLLASIGALPHSGITVPFLAHGVTSACVATILLSMVVAPLINREERESRPKLRKVLVSGRSLVAVLVPAVALALGILVPFRSILPPALDRGASAEQVQAYLGSIATRTVVAGGEHGVTAVKLRRSASSQGGWTVLSGADRFSLGDFSGLLTLPEFEEPLRPQQVAVSSLSNRLSFRPALAQEDSIALNPDVQKNLVEHLDAQESVVAAGQLKVPQAALVVTDQGGLVAAASVPRVVGQAETADEAAADKIRDEIGGQRFGDRNAKQKIDASECGKGGADCYRVVLTRSRDSLAQYSTEGYGTPEPERAKLERNHLYQTGVASGPSVAWLITLVYLSESQDHSLDDIIDFRPPDDLEETELCTQSRMSVRYAVTHQCGSALAKLADKDTWAGVLDFGQSIGMTVDDSGLGNLWASANQRDIALEAQGRGPSEVSPSIITKLLLVATTGRTAPLQAEVTATGTEVLTQAQRDELAEALWGPDGRIEFNCRETHRSLAGRVIAVRGENSIRLVVSFGSEETTATLANDNTQALAEMPLEDK